MQQIVIDIHAGANTILGSIVKHFENQNYQIPKSVFGWENELPREYEWYFIIRNYREDGINIALRECRELQLRSFIILPAKDMIIGG